VRNTVAKVDFLAFISFSCETTIMVSSALETNQLTRRARRLADDLANVLANRFFRVFTSRDVIGVEVGGSVKNVIALSAGMCEVRRTK